MREKDADEGERRGTRRLRTNSDDWREKKRREKEKGTEKTRLTEWRRDLVLVQR